LKQKGDGTGHGEEKGFATKVKKRRRVWEETDKRNWRPVLERLLRGVGQSLKLAGKKPVNDRAANPTKSRGKKPVPNGPEKEGLEKSEKKDTRVSGRGGLEKSPRWEKGVCRTKGGEGEQRKKKREGEKNLGGLG